MVVIPAAKYRKLLKSRKEEMRMKKYYKGECQKKQDIIDRLIKEKKQQQMKKNDNRFFTLEGSMNLALRRCMSNSAANALGLTLQMDVHRTTVVRFEVNLRAALLASSWHFHKTYQQLLAEDLDGEEDHDHCCRFEVHGMRGDATNSQVWQKSKLRVAFLETIYVSKTVKPTDSWIDVMRQSVHWQ